MTQPAKQSILVVDDDVEILRLVREVLAGLATCAVDTTPSPAHAFELSLKKHYDLFLFDFTMPVIDGAVLFGLIRTAYQHAGIVPQRILPPLILISGHAEKQHARDLLHEPGVCALLPKPFSIHKLLTSIEACLPGVTQDSRLHGGHP